MSKDDAFQALLHNKESYSFHKVEGLPAVLIEQLVAQDEIAVGDKIELFRLPDGKYFVSKTGAENDRAFTIGKITSAYIYFNDEITIKEQ